MTDAPEPIANLGNDPTVDHERKVLTLDRQVYVHKAPEEPQDALEPVEVVVDQEVVELLSEALERARSGEIRGVVLFMGIRSEKDPETVTFVTPLSTSAADDHYQLFVGSMEEMKADLIAIQSDLYIEVDLDE